MIFAVIHRPTQRAGCLMKSTQSVYMHHWAMSRSHYSADPLTSTQTGTLKMSVTLHWSWIKISTAQWPCSLLSECGGSQFNAPWVLIHLIQSLVQVRVSASDQRRKFMKVTIIYKSARRFVRSVVTWSTTDYVYITNFDQAEWIWSSLVDAFDLKCEHSSC